MSDETPPMPPAGPANPVPPIDRALSATPPPWSHLPPSPPPAPEGGPAAPPREQPSSPPVLPPVVGERAPLWLTLTVTGLGLILLFSCLALPLPSATPEQVGHRIGLVIGTMIFWPLIIIGLFSLAKSLRTTRVRLWILLVVWGLSLLGAIGRLSRRTQTVQQTRPVPEAAAAAQPLPASESNQSPATRGRPSIRAEQHREALVYDFSRGSDERLIKMIEESRTERYRAVAAAYATACGERPRDAVLALERVKFIAHFAFAEDNPIEGAEADHEAAQAYLNNHFPDEPGTVLYMMGQHYGEEVERTAREHADEVASWPAEDRARFLLLRARAAVAAEAPVRARRYASESFQAHATPEAGLLLAEKLHEEGRDQECAQVLLHAVFTDAPAWTHKQQMDLLFDAGRADLALPLFKELAGASPDLVQQTDTVQHLIQGGFAAEARELLKTIPLQDWNRRNVLRARFEFELAHGNENQALSAYREMRATGYTADPFLRDRLALLWRFPAAGWTWADLAGLGGLILLFVCVILLPLLVLLPVHYWSLLRERRAAPGVQAETTWGLRRAWVIVGVWLAAEAAGIWLWQPAIMRSWVDDKAQVPAYPEQALLSHMALVWGVQVLVMAFAFWRLQSWRMFGPGEWSRGRAIRSGLALTLAIRVLLGVYLALWPGALGDEVAVMAQQLLCTALLKQFGAGGMIVVVAGLVPLLEEFMFRGVLLRSLAKHIPFWAANLAQALLFASAHENIGLAPFFVLLGLACGVLARRSGGLMAAVVLHSANNLIVTISLALLHGRAG